MKKAEYNILPVTEEILQTMGEQIKLARLRRSLSAELVAERAGSVVPLFGRLKKERRQLLWVYMQPFCML